MAVHIVSEHIKSSKKYNVLKKHVCFKLNDMHVDVENPEEWVKNGVMDIVEYVAQGVAPDDKVGFTFSSEGFSEGNAYLSFKKASGVTFQEIWDLIGQLYQSRTEGFHSDTFRITMTQARPFKGAAKRRSIYNTYNTFEEECKARKGIITITNKDNLCLPRALVVAMAYLMNVPYFKQIRKNTGRRQDEEVQKLMAETGIRIPPDGAGFEELQQFQQHLKDFQITVYEYGTKGREVFFQGSDAPKKINLIHHNNHYNVIRSLTAAFSCGYYCQPCRMPYNTIGEHKCKGGCPCCLQTPPCEITREEVTCAECGRKFRGLVCYERHKAPKSYGKKTVCEELKYCSNCLHMYKAKRIHFCGEIFCVNCKKHQPKGHMCYIRPNEGNPPDEDEMLFIFYDLESRQDELDDNGDKIHIPNLCVLQQRCGKCIEDGNELVGCSKCGERRKIIKDGDVITSFVNYILKVRKGFRKVIVTAHNARGYDSHFILKHILEKTQLKAELIMRGTLVIMMEFENVKFIDSLSYFPMPLSELPKSFNLGPELKKGYFPHLFNTRENANYIGPMPDIEYYDPGSMKEHPTVEKDKRAAFLQWYEEHKNDQFDMQRDLIDYCISDVDILTRACLKFRKMMLSESDVDPFAEAVTIASACHLVFRRKFLKPFTVGLIPKGGYRNADKQSKIALQWLIWEEEQRGINILNSAKHREVIIGRDKVDGFCQETQQIFEFHGCYYHGHTCFTDKRDDPLHEDPLDTLNNRYLRTSVKTNRLRAAGFEVIEMWECSFRRIMKQNKEKQKELENHPLLVCAPLEPRDSFYGGRTGNCVLRYLCKPGEKIKYVDICSLYPWACKYGKFPVEHPIVYVGSECEKLNLREIDGLIKCKILPPTDLFHPVLPMKANNRLMFSLCRTCSLELNQGECSHSEEERALTGTWVLEEVKAALERGYKILNIYEIWRYKTIQHSRDNNVKGIFTDMMGKFMKLKQQASGWPADCTTEEKKIEYIEKYLDREDVQLDYSEIADNPGLRSLAKLILTSFWGKFGQRVNQPKTTIVRTMQEYYNLVNNPSVVVNNMEIINEDTLVINYEYKEEASEPNSITNVVVAAFVTTIARLKLYSYLEKLGDRVIYFDTDSVIYVSREGAWDVPTGSFLGEMKDELLDYGPASYITAFTSGGPKNYSFMVFSPTYQTYYTLCKVKGINLNYNAFQKINFNSMTEMVSTENPEPIYITSMNIRRSKEHQVVTRAETKIYLPCCEKRRFVGESSLPYGYKRLKLE